MGKTIMINIEKCLACRSCEIACAVAHSKSKVFEKAIKESPKPHKRVTVEPVGKYGVPMQCRHCEQAPCISVCPTGAIRRPEADSPVLIEQDRCIGCQFCLMICPFGVIDVSSDGKAMVKCDLCFERTNLGQQPACVEACPTKALKLVDAKDLGADRRRLAAWELVILNQQDNNKKERKENK